MSFLLACTGCLAGARVIRYSVQSLPFKPYDQNLNSHCYPLFIPTDVVGEFDKISSKFILCDHVSNSHDHSVLQSIDITRRTLMLITLKA